MPRIVKTKELANTRLATNYGGWTYCEACGENIGYLCYATYDKAVFKYTCRCGSTGSILTDFEDSQQGTPCSDQLIIIKNRLCCPKDNSPLMTIIDKKLTDYDLQITCKACGNIYHKVAKM